MLQLLLLHFLKAVIAQLIFLAQTQVYELFKNKLLYENTLLKSEYYSPVFHSHLMKKYSDCSEILTFFLGGGSRLMHFSLENEVYQKIPFPFLEYFNKSSNT